MWEALGGLDVGGIGRTVLDPWDELLEINGKTVGDHGRTLWGTLRSPW